MSNWYALSAHGCFSLAYLRVKRYAVISAFSWSLRCKAGINEPGLNVSGSAIHAFRVFAHCLR